MPLIAHNSLPSFARLSDQGVQVRQIPEPGFADLHIGFLNMMPDAALSATEQQFMRLIGTSDVAANIYFYPFSIEELGRGDAAMAYVRSHYFEFPELVDRGLHAMISTGANVIDPDLEKEPIWKPLIAVADWARAHTASTLCSCLASHAIVKHSHDIDRRRLPRKHWGVYGHHVCDASHPLMTGVPGEFDAPHSRWNDVSRQQLEDSGFIVLASGGDAGVHLAVSNDGFRVVFTQGHPEYDANSLLKEYKREVSRYFDGELDAPPPFPENYLPDAAKEIASRHIENFENGAAEFPEDEIAAYTASRWGEAGGAIMRNWLELVRQLAHRNPKLQFAEGVNPEDPLSLRTSATTGTTRSATVDG